MKESKRQFLVNDLNRVLPMVSETIAKFEEFYALCDEWKNKEKELENIKNAIKYNESFFNSLSETEVANEKLSPVISTIVTNLNARKRMLEDIIPEYKQKANVLHEEIVFEEGYYANVMNYWLPGFLKKDDIQDKYLKELAYLMSGKIANGSDAFFDDDVTKQNFYIRLDTKYPQAQDKTFVLNEEDTREKFYQIFNK